MRELLDNKEIDAITSATPNHWHALITVWACQAGKDVYIEKPASHEIWEGRKMVEAARKYNRIVQIGTQKRSSEAHPAAYQWIREGNIGKIKWSRGFCYKGRGPGTNGIVHGTNGPKPVPASVDYNLWCGPADMVPLCRDATALRLALDVEHRLRRHRQPGSPRDGHRPLGTGRSGPADPVPSASAAGSASARSATSARPPTPRSPSSTTSRPR